MHICVGKLIIVGSDNGLSPVRPQAIIWTNAGIWFIGPLATNFSENFNCNGNIYIKENVFENVVWKMSAILSRPKCVNGVMFIYHWITHACACSYVLNAFKICMSEIVKGTFMNLDFCLRLAIDMSFCRYDWVSFMRLQLISSKQSHDQVQPIDGGLRTLQKVQYNQQLIGIMRYPNLGTRNAERYRGNSSSVSNDVT